MLERKIQGSLTKIEQTDGDTYLTVVTSNPNTLLKKYKQYNDIGGRNENI